MGCVPHGTPLKPPEQRVRNHSDAEPQHSPVAIEISAETTRLLFRKRGKPCASAASFRFSEMIEDDQTAQDECESNQQARIVHVEHYSAPEAGEKLKGELPFDSFSSD